MIQKYLAMVVILGAIAGLGIGMVTTQAKAFERTCHYWSNGDSQCEWGPYFAYTQHPTVQQTSLVQPGTPQSHILPVDGCPCGNGKGFWTCANCDGFTQQPQLQEIAYTPTNCFWSYPVQCN